MIPETAFLPLVDMYLFSLAKLHLKL